MKNKLTDLNDHLFAQLERLSDEALKGEKLDAEMRRADAVSKLSSQIVAGADLQLKAAKMVAEYGGRKLPSLPQLGVPDNG